jgi:sec-independent protein translocase protein TatA
VIGDILQPTHLLFILAVALLVLGPKRLPEAGRALGKGIRDFRMAIGGEDQNHGAIPSDTMSSPAPPMAPVPVSPAPEPADAPPPPPPSGPPPPAASAPSATETPETAEPAHPFV